MIKKKLRRGRALWGFDLRLRDPLTGRKTRRVRIYEFDSRTDAETAASLLLLADRQAKFGLAPAADRPLLRELVEAKLARIERRSELVRARRVFTAWLEVLPADIRVDEIKTASISRYLERRQAEGLSPASINREVNIIAAALHAAGEHFPELEQWRPPKIPRLKAASRRERIITDAEAALLLEYLQRPLALGEAEYQRAARLRVAHVFEFALATGARHGEISALRWTDIDWDRRRITIFQSKTGHYKEIPLTSTIERILDERSAAADGQPGEFVFTRNGQIYGKFYSMLREAAEACGLEYGQKNGGFVLHSARHTVTSKLVEAGLDLETIGLITGHRSKHLVAHYAHRHAESFRRAAEALDSVSRSRTNNGHDLG